jgi:hypothetical protein
VLHPPSSIAAAEAQRRCTAPSFGAYQSLFEAPRVDNRHLATVPETQQ